MALSLPARPNLEWLRKTAKDRLVTLRADEPAAQLADAQLAVARNCGRFEWAVLDWNQPAIDFYRSVGADLLPDWRLCRLTGDALKRFAAQG